MADLGTVTITEEIAPAPDGENMSKLRKIKFAWVSEDGGGNAGKASKTTTYKYTGEIIRLITIPSGAVAPSDNYTVTITDEDGCDVLMGSAVGNRDTANTEQVLASSLGCVMNDALTLNISGAGNAKQGTAIIYIK